MYKLEYENFKYHKIALVVNLLLLFYIPFIYSPIHYFKSEFYFSEFSQIIVSSVFYYFISLFPVSIIIWFSCANFTKIRKTLLVVLFTVNIYLVLTIVIFTNFFFDGASITPEQNQWIIIPLSLATVLFIIYFGKNRELLSVYFLALVVAISIYSFSRGWQAKKYSPDNITNVIKLSKIENKILFIFDGMPSHISLKVGRDNQAFNDFIYFKNAITKHPGTWASLQEILGGPNNSFLEINKRGGMPRDFIYSGAAQETIQKFNSVGWDGSYHKYVYERTGNGGAPIPVSLALNIYSMMPEELRKTFIEKNYLIRIEKSLIEYAKKFSLNGKIQVDRYIWPIYGDRKFSEDLINISNKIIISQSPKKSINIFYFSIPHAPYFLDRTCQVFYEKVSKYESQVEQNMCALHIVEQFISRLKILGYYQNSTILITSDHGWAKEDGDPIADISYQDRSFQGRMTKKNIFTTLIYKPAKNINIDPDSPIYTQSALQLLCLNNKDCPNEFQRNIEVVDKVYVTKPFDLNSYTGTYVIIDELSSNWSQKEKLYKWNIQE